MHIAIRYFAGIREQMGQSAEQVQTTAVTVGALRDELIARGDPWAQALSRSRPVRCSVAQVLCEESAVLKDGVEVAFFPPVTGG